MKTAKRIYYPLVALLLALFLTFSFVHVFNAGGKSKADDDFLSRAQSYAEKIESVRETNSASSTQHDEAGVREEILYALGFNGLKLNRALSSDKTSTDGNGDETSWTEVRYSGASASVETVVTYFEKDYIVSVEKQIELAKASGNTENLHIALDRVVNNIIVIVPGKKSKANQPADAVLFTAHMDAPKNMPSATGSAMIGVMLAEISSLKAYELEHSAAKYDNDLVFLFTDARYDASFGIHTFMDQFYGFFTAGATSSDPKKIEAIVDRIGLAINFDSLGNGSSSLLLQTSKNNSRLVSQYAKAMGGSLSSSFVSDIYKDYASDFQGFDGLNALNLVTFGGNKNNATAYDSMGNLSKSFLGKKSDMLLRSVEHFGNMSLTKLDAKNDSVYLSFLGMFTVSYPAFMSYILGVIILLLFGAAVYINRKKKAFNLATLGRGVLIQVLSILATVAAMFVLYFIMGVILSGFGLFTIQSLISYAYGNAGIIIGYSLFALAMLCLFYNIIRKLFATQGGAGAISAVNIVRAGAVTFSAIGTVLCFAYPALAILFAIPSVLFMTTLLVLTALKKENDKSSLERMLFYLVPTAIALAFIVPTVCMLSLAVQSVLLPVIMLPLILLLAVSAPYMLMLIKPLSVLFKKLPKRTIRVQRVVTERIEDKAKPGKFTEVTSKKITKEKTEWKYRNGVGMAFVAVLAAVIIMACSALSVPFGSNVYTGRTFREPVNQYVSNIYDNSLLLVWSYSGEATQHSETSLEIHDKSAYKYLRYCLEDYSWDADKGSYVKPVDAVITDTPKIERVEGTIFRVNSGMFESRGVMEVTLYDAENIKSVAVSASATDDADYTIENIGSKTITIRVGLDDSNYGNEFYLNVEWKANTRPNSISTHLSQYIWADENALMHTSSVSVTNDVKKIKDYFADNYSAEVQDAVRYGVLLKIDQTISL